MAEREIGKVLGGQRADIANAGFSFSGTALDLMRDSAVQGEITKTLIETQGTLDENAYKLQAEGFNIQAKTALTQAAAADNAAKGATTSAIIKGATAVAGMFAFSDRRLKRNIKRIGTADNGLPIYVYQYHWSEVWHIGFMADEVGELHPDAVTRNKRGWMMVDYSKAVL
jgi:hypothetical protein